MTPDKLSREDILDWIKYHDWYDDTSAGLWHSAKVKRAIRSILTEHAALKDENERLKEELLRLRTPLHLHHRLDETAALAAKEGK